MSTRPQGRTAELQKLISASVVDIMSTTEDKIISLMTIPYFLHNIPYTKQCFLFRKLKKNFGLRPPS